MNPYEILGVEKTADDAAIKRAYHKFVMKYHPDKNAGDKGAEEKFKEVNNAFDILKDPQKRAAYDRFGASAFAGGNGASAGTGGFGGGNPFGFDTGGFSGFDNIDLNEMMDGLFEQMGGRGFSFNMGNMGGGARRRGPAEFRGRDLIDTVVLDLREAYAGKTITLKFATNVKCDTCGGYGTADGKPAPVCETCHGTGTVRTRRGLFGMETACPDCHGTGRTIKNPCKACDGAGVIHKNRELSVKIPAGVMDGTRLKLSGQGEAAPFGGKSGDFYVDVRVKTDRVFTRDGDDLLMRANVPFAKLALGGEIEVMAIDDKKLSVKIPSGTQVGEKMRVRGQGMPTGRDGRGDLYLDIATEVPRKLSEKQKKALSDFAGADAKKKGWF